MGFRPTRSPESTEVRHITGDDWNFLSGPNPSARRAPTAKDKLASAVAKYMDKVAKKRWEDPK